MIIKKILCLILVLSTNAFALGGFEVGLNVPVGGATSFRTYKFSSSITKEAQEKIKDMTKADTGFETGVNLQIGYRFDFNKPLSLSLLFDTGYNYNFLGWVNVVDSTKYFYWFHLHTLSIGVLPKLNINNFSIGLGAGIKIPLKAAYYESENKKAYQLSESDDNTYYAAIPYSKLKDKVFKSLVIPYIKLTFDYNLLLKHNLSMNFGIYTGYDFNINMKERNSYEKSSLSSFDFGVQVGLKFSKNK